MKQEEKELLFKDLCARLPYGVKVKCASEILTLNVNWLKVFQYHLDEIKPYLRPMSSMTEEEAKHLFLLHNDDRKEYEILEVSIGNKYIDFKIDDGCCSFESYTIWYEDAVYSIESYDYLTAHHFDYRGLIPMGLALEAPEGMYK